MLFHILKVYRKIFQQSQVWKSRKLSYKGKTIIVKNLLLSYCGFEIEMKGIPDKFKKEIETLM
jgi:uncharacterized protein YfbU (UPF0304 family)